MTSSLALILLPALLAGVFAAIAIAVVLKFWLRGERRLLQQEMATRFEQVQQEIARQLAELPAAKARSLQPAAPVRPLASVRPAAPSSALPKEMPAAQPGGAYLYAGDPNSLLRRQFIPVGAKLRIGRSTDCDIVFAKANAVSKIHAMIEVADGQVWLADLDSRNGTFINGHRISRRTQVPDLATLSFGGVEARLVRL